MAKVFSFSHRDNAQCHIHTRALNFPSWSETNTIYYWSGIQTNAMFKTFWRMCHYLYNRMKGPSNKGLFLTFCFLFLCGQIDFIISENESFFSELFDMSEWKSIIKSLLFFEYYFSELPHLPISLLSQCTYWLAKLTDKAQLTEV